ncbi:hypothetical protein PAPHI01_2250, partial [Pancytospora philotis]
MRCASKFTCIAQCLAASLSTLHQAGLLTDELYEKCTSAGICSSASRGGKLYEPKKFPRFTEEMPKLAKPVRGDNPLETIAINAWDAAPLDVYIKAKDKSLKEYLVLLKKYIKEVYHQNGFDKHVEESIVKAATAALAEDIAQLFASPERVLACYAYTRSLLCAYTYNYRKFGAVMLTMIHTSRDIASVVENPHDKELENLDDATIKELNRLRIKLNGRTAEAENVPSGCFRKFISDSVLNKVKTSDITDADFINRVARFCKNSLEYVYAFQENLSTGVIAQAVSIGARDEYFSEHGKDPYMFVHF